MQTAKYRSWAASVQLAPLFMFSISSGILPGPDVACIGRSLAGAARLPLLQRPKPPLRSRGVRLAHGAAVQCRRLRLPPGEYSTTVALRVPYISTVHVHSTVLPRYYS